jgi:hypothetical protein
MRRTVWPVLLSILCVGALAGCGPTTGELPATGIATTAPLTVPATAAETPALSPTEPPPSVAAPTVAAPTVTVPTVAVPNATWPPQPSPTPPEPGLADLPPIPGLTDPLLLALGDGSLVVRYPDTGQITELLPRGMYQVRDDAHLIPILWPVRMAPAGEPRAIIATPADGTWLVRLDGTRTQLSERRLLATWAPDGRRIVYTDSSPTTGLPETGEVYIRELDADAPQLLATVPGRAWNALWAPGCDGCPDAVAVAAQIDTTLAITLIDVATGETRLLGEFTPPPMGGNLFHSWSADGRYVVAQSEARTLAFPVEGGSPQPFVAVGAVPDGLPSPDGRTLASIARDGELNAQVSVVALDSGAETAVARTFPQVERSFWSDDGRYLLLESYDCTASPCVYRLWAVDGVTAEATLAAEAVAFIGSGPMLQARATETAGLVGSIIPTADRLGEGEWLRHELDDTGIVLEAPAAWSVTGRGDRLTVANFDSAAPGGVALGAGDVWIVADWVDWYGSGPDYTDATMLSEMYDNQDPAVVDVGNRQGARLRARLNPSCSRYLVNHRGGALDMTICGVGETTNRVVDEFLARLDFGPGQ